MIRLFFLIFFSFTLARIMPIMAANVQAGELDEDAIITPIEDTMISAWHDWWKNTPRYVGWRQQSRAGTGRLIYGVCETKSSHSSHFKNHEEASSSTVISARLNTTTVSSSDGYWLFSPVYTTGQMLSVHVTVQFQIQRCPIVHGASSNGSILCREKFNLMIRHSRKPDRSIEPADFHLLSHVTARPRPPKDDLANTGASSGGNSFYRDNEYFSQFRIQFPIANRREKWFQLALHDRGACVLVDQFLIYHVSCRKIETNLTVFPQTQAGHAREIRSVRGKCVTGASIASNGFNAANGLETNGRSEGRGGGGGGGGSYDGVLEAFCLSNGRWQVNSHTSCVCQMGHQLNGKGREYCDACPRGTYKSKIGNERCEACPLNSIALHTGLTECKCLAGYHRIGEVDTKGAHRGCYGPPSAPRNLHAAHINGTSVVLRWDWPVRTGGLEKQMKFHIRCQGCSMEHVHYNPGRVLNGTKVHITGLYPMTRHQFDVFAQNDVSHSVNTSYIIASLIVTTGTAPTTLISGITHYWISDTALSLKWVAYEMHLKTHQDVPPPSSTAFSPSSSLSALHLDSANVPNSRAPTFQVCIITNGANEDAPRSASTSTSSHLTQMGLISPPVAIYFAPHPELIIRNLTANVNYYVQIRAQNSHDFGPFSSPVPLIRQIVQTDIVNQHNEAITRQQFPINPSKVDGESQMQPRMQDVATMFQGPDIQSMPLPPVAVYRTPLVGWLLAVGFVSLICLLLLASLVVLCSYRKHSLRQWFHLSGIVGMYKLRNRRNTHGVNHSTDRREDGRSIPASTWENTSAVIMTTESVEIIHRLGQNSLGPTFLGTLRPGPNPKNDEEIQVNNLAISGHLYDTSIRHFPQAPCSIQRHEQPAFNCQTLKNKHYVGGEGLLKQPSTPLAKRTSYAVRLQSLQNIWNTDLDGSSSSAKERLCHAIQSVMQLRHPNVLQTYGIGWCQGQPMLIQDWLIGGTLADYVERVLDIDCLSLSPQSRGQRDERSGRAEHVYDRLPLTFVLNVLVDIVNGLQYIHQNGMTYRGSLDLNTILLDSQARCKLRIRVYPAPNPVGHDHRVPASCDWCTDELISKMDDGLYGRKLAPVNVTKKPPRSPLYSPLLFNNEYALKKQVHDRQIFNPPSFSETAHALELRNDFGDRPLGSFSVTEQNQSLGPNISLKEHYRRLTQNLSTTQKSPLHPPDQSIEDTRNLQLREGVDSNDIRSFGGIQVQLFLVHFLLNQSQAGGNQTPFGWRSGVIHKHETPLHHTPKGLSTFRKQRGSMMRHCESSLSTACSPIHVLNQTTTPTRIVPSIMETLLHVNSDASETVENVCILLESMYPRLQLAKLIRTCHDCSRDVCVSMVAEVKSMCLQIRDVVLFESDAVEPVVRMGESIDPTMVSCLVNPVI